MDIATYEDLLSAAREQAEPQRLLFVFTRAVLPEGSTAEQRADFAAGRGGTLEPLMSVDKAPEDLGSFAALVEESRQFASDWSIVFVSALAGRNGRAPTGDEADRSLQGMIQSIERGSFGSFIPFDRRGAPLLLAPRGRLP
jgi:hypothetical protein